MENRVGGQILERCLKERIDREMVNIVDMFEGTIQNGILTTTDIIVTPGIELEVRSKNASSGHDAGSVIKNLQCGQRIGVTASLENVSERYNTFHELSTDDETRGNIRDKVSELSVPRIRFDRQSHTHHMVPGQTAQTNQIAEFLTGRILTPHDPPSNKHHSLSTQVSQDNSLPKVEQTLNHQNSDLNNSFSRLAEAFAGIASQHPSYDHKQL